MQRDTAKEEIYTARKIDEVNLRRLATVVLNSNDAITIQDFEGKITAWNRGAELVYSYSEQEALQMNIWDLTPPDKAEEQKDFNRRLLAGEAVASLETRRLTKDGRLLDVWMTVTKLVRGVHGGRPTTGALLAHRQRVAAHKMKEDTSRHSTSGCCQWEAMPWTKRSGC